MPQAKTDAPANNPNSKTVRGILGSPINRPNADNIVAIVIEDQRSFHPQRLYDACQRHLGTEHFRTKGFVWLVSRPAEVLHWKQSGSQICFGTHECVGL